MLNLPEPVWADVLGAADEAAWIADRDRKIGKALELANEIQTTFEYLSAHGAIYRATPEILLAHPFAARWYVSLAGYAQKTLQNIRDRPLAFGLTVRPITVVDCLCEREVNYQVPERLRNNAERFCLWINDEIQQKHPAPIRNAQRALILVSEILGGRVIGQGQNEGGEVAVLLVKNLLVQQLLSQYQLEVSTPSGWENYTEAFNLSDAAKLRFGHLMICDFTSGGNRPDIRISMNDDVIAVGEIKGRKDLSNVWESWMPQVATHMNAWSLEFPRAVRVFFGTLIVPEMVEGYSVRRTRQIGFKELHETGRLTSVYNVGNVVAGQPGATTSFGHFVAELARILRLAL